MLSCLVKDADRSGADYGFARRGFIFHQRRLTSFLSVTADTLRCVGRPSVWARQSSPTRVATPGNFGLARARALKGGVKKFVSL